MQNLKRKLQKNLTIKTQMHTIASIGFNIWVTLIAPLVIGYYVTLYFNAITISDPKTGFDSFWNTHSIPVVILILAHIFVSLWLFLQTRMSHTADEFDLISEKLELSKIENSKILRKMEFVDYSVITIDAITDLFKNNPQFTKSEIYRNVLHVLSQFREGLFNFGGKALYNFVIYEYNPNSNLLEIKERIHDDRLDTQGRSWEVGVGHVGISFANKRCMICHDASNSTELPMSKNDASNYSSFISSPIVKPLAQDQSQPLPYGVLVITSSEPNQFITDLHDDFLRNLCDIMSIVLTSMEEKQNEQ